MAKPAHDEVSLAEADSYWAEYSKQQQAILHADAKLSAEQLDDKYNPDGEGRHPVFLQEEWMQEVVNLNTLRGYWDWVASQIEQTK